MENYDETQETFCKKAIIRHDELLQMSKNLEVNSKSYM